MNDMSLSDDARRSRDLAPEQLREFLRERPGLVEWADSVGRTLLLSACCPLTGTASVERVRVLIAAGSNVAAKDNYGLTGLHGIVYSHRPGRLQPAAEIIDLLVAHGADVDAIDNEGNTPLMRAVLGWRIGMELDAIDRLLAHGARVDCINKHGVSPRSLMTRMGMPERRVDPRHKSNEGLGG